ncbi:MAG: hypothetical protein FWC26_04515 [Fibromonadales bacterium]|nr:hypothetical protein [Fibromonadales bacterium]
MRIKQYIKEAVAKALGEGIKEDFMLGDDSILEMAKMCDKDRDGHGFYIYVKGSDDPNSGRREHLPIHAHVLAQLKPEILIGKIDLTSETEPNSANEVIDADKETLLPADAKREIVKWAKEKDDDIPGLNKWQASRAVFKKLNPYLFN